MRAHELFEALVKSHVEQPLNFQESAVQLIAKLVPQAAEPIAALANPSSWQPFMPPLHNFLITCIEVFLERYFLENYTKPNGARYETIENWRGDLKTFVESHTWPDKTSRKQIKRSFSFQNLDAVAVLYDVALRKPIHSHRSYALIQLMFDKRNLFTHRAGLIDEKFRGKYNVYHHGDPSKLLPHDSIGRAAILERDWVRDAIREARAFVAFIAR